MIDDMAFSGYDYALSGGTLPIPEMTTEMDVLAFNAGISNANIRQGLNIEKIAAYSATHIDGRTRASEKELRTVWGSN